MRFLLEDRSGKGAKGLARSLKTTESKAKSLGSTLRRVAVIAGGVFGLRAAKSSLIDFNSFMEQAKLRTAGLLSLTKKTDLADQLGAASDVMLELQQRAKVSTATTREMVAFMTEIAQPVIAAGLETKDLAKFTAQAVVAAKAFGDEGIAAFDIQQALFENVKIRDRFSKKLLDLQSDTAREAFNELSIKEKLVKIQEALGGKQIEQLAKKQATSFAGIFSTLQDNIEIVLGKVGLPLFKALTGEIQNMVNLIGQNEGRIAAIAKSIGVGIVQGFKFAKDFFLSLVQTARDVAAILGPVFKSVIAAFKFVGVNKNTIIFLAKALIAAKAIKGVAGFFTAFGSGLGKVATKANLAAVGLAALFLAANAAAKAIDEQQEATLGRRGQQRFLRDRLTELPKQLKGEPTPEQAQDLSLLLKQAQEAKFIDEKGNISLATVATELTGQKFANEMSARAFVNFSTKQSEANRIQQGLLLLQSFMRSESFTNAREQIVVAKNRQAQAAELSRIQTSNLLNSMQAVMNVAQKALGLPAVKIPGAQVPAVGGVKADKKPPRVNVTINRMEIQSDDPDRFVFGMISAFQDAAANPNGAVDTFKLRQS